MTDSTASLLSSIPSVDKLLRLPNAETLIDSFGRQPVTNAVRDDLAALRQALTKKSDVKNDDVSAANILARVAARLEAGLAPSLKPVFNLTGTVLHTNLGRAPLPPEAIEAVAAVARGASNLEYDIPSGRRGDRDVHLDEQVGALTGAEGATVVNNNAAAVLLVLNALALRKEVIVSRGELIEIGGAFRMPDIMARAGAKLVEVGTTNRTHLKDFAEAIGPRTGLIMKVHTSNYEVRGFTASVDESELASLAHAHDIPYVVDLGSGTLTDLSRFGLPHEPTAQETLAAGADIVTFSGDKLLGGPQAGVIVGRGDLVAKIKKNPLKRAMRCDKMTIAALSSVLNLYRDPDRLVERIPALRLLARSQDDIAATAQRLLPSLQAAAGDVASVACTPCQSQIGSGSMPEERLDSMAIMLRPIATRGVGSALKRIASAFRALPVPVIGRVQEDAFWLDCRCLEPADEAAFTGQLAALALGTKSRP